MGNRSDPFRNLRKIRISVDSIEKYIIELESSAYKVKECLHIQSEELKKIHQALDFGNIVINGRSISEKIDELSMHPKTNQIIIEENEKSIEALNRLVFSGSDPKNSPSESKAEANLVER